jgi:hypothetical protein
VAIALGIGAAVYAQRGRAANVTADVLKRTGTADDAMPCAWLRYGKTQSETATARSRRSTAPTRLGKAALPPAPPPAAAAAAAPGNPAPEQGK